MTTSDPRPLLDRALAQAGQIVAGTRPDQLGAPTPCRAFDVAALLGHLVGVAHRVAEVARGDSTGDLHVPTGVAPDAWASVFAAARADAATAWDATGPLNRQVALPFGSFDAATVAGIYTLELTAHAWDLAAATGQTARLDPELAEASLLMATQVLPPEPRGEPIPFGPVIDVADGAPVYERLAGYLGRQWPR